MKNFLIVLMVATPLLLFTGCSENPQRGNPELAALVKEQFVYAWNAYKTYAWGKDALKPVSKSSENWYEHSLHISPIDAYSTMKVMGLEKEAAEVEAYVLENVNFDKDIFVKTFEVNIRVLGGLLAMYQYTQNPEILSLAGDFGDRLLPAFNSPTGIPYYWVNLKTGEVKGADVNIAEGGSYLFEMGILSKVTGNPVYYEKAKKTSKAIFERRSPLGLIGERINIETGQWTDNRSHIGCCIDSYYEYLIKSWILFGDEELKQMWDESIAAVNKYIADEHSSGFWYSQADMNTGEVMNRIVTLYDAYFPAVLALSGKLEQAAKFQDSFDKLWNKNGLEPMVYDYATDSLTNASYDLNPEIMESAYYLYYYTHDQKYALMNQKYLNDLIKYCKNEVAFTCIENVVTKERSDNLPTFFFAETLKYLYLTFAPEGQSFLDEYVLSTEAHPFKKDFINQQKGGEN